MNSENIANLNLIGANEEDLKVISAYLQDSIVIVRDIVFLKKNKSFVMIVNRFMWEDVEKGILRSNKRVRSAVRFEGVIEVKSKNINQKNQDLVLELIAIDYLKNKDDYEVNLIFNNNAHISLRTDSIEVRLEDQNEV